MSICIAGVTYTTANPQPSNGLGAETNDSTNYFPAPSEVIPSNSGGPYFAFAPFGAAMPCEVDSENAPQPPAFQSITGLSATMQRLRALNVLNQGTTP